MFTEHSQNSLQFINAIHLLQGTKPDTGLETWSYESWVEGNNHLLLESAIQNLNMATESSILLQIHQVALSDVFLIKP